MQVTRTAWVTAAGVVGALGLAMLLRGSDAGAPASGDTTRAPVVVAALRREALPGEVRAGGFLRARLDVTVAAERAGRVVELPVAEGAAVTADTVVARLDDTVATANLERARAVARETALQPDAAAAELARADEALRVANHELRLRRPTAPFDGVVEVHHVDPGDYVQPGTPLVDVVDARVVLLDVDVDAEVVGHVKRGDAVRVAVQSLGGSGARQGEVTRVAARATPRTRRFRIEIALQAPEGALRPGMHGEARFALPAGAPGLYVPKATVRRVRGQLGVFVVEEQRARWRPLRVAEVYARPDLYLVVGDSLREGESLVVSGFSGLRDGTAVEIGK